MIVFLLSGHRSAAADKAKQVLAPRLICLVLVLLLAFHLNGTLRRTSAHLILQNRIRKALATGVVQIPGARLVDVTLVERDNKTTAWAVARTPQPISPEQVARLSNLASSLAEREISLTVRSVITAETTRYGNVYEPDLQLGEFTDRRWARLNRS